MCSHKRRHFVKMYLSNADPIDLCTESKWCGIGTDTTNISSCIIRIAGKSRRLTGLVISPAPACVLTSNESYTFLCFRYRLSTSHRNKINSGVATIFVRKIEPVHTKLHLIILCYDSMCNAR